MARHFLLLLLVSIGTGCVTAAAFHPTLHPSRDGTADAAGIGMGALYAMSPDDESYLQAPYGEGFARFGLGSGQLELRASPALGYVGYRIDIMSAKRGFGLAVKPSLGLGYWSVSDAADDSSQLALAPNLSILLAFADGAAYVAPRFGYLYWRTSESGNSDSTGILSVGGNVGYVVDSDPFDISVELGFQRVTSTEENAGDAVYFIVPSVGLQL